MKRRNALGRGLDSLISIDEVRTEGSSVINEIEVDRIVPNPSQPRRTFDEESLDELATSIRELGIVQPLTLRVAGDGSYQIIAGERRWRAARRAGLHSVPAYVLTASDSEVTEMALIENIQREDLNAIEVALGFKKLIDSYNLTQERLSERLGKKRATIANHLRLLRLPAEIQLGLRDKKLDMGHARALLSVADPKKQLKLYTRILKEGLSVRKVEELARAAAREENEGEDISGGKKPSVSNSDYDFFARELANYFPTPVKFTRTPSGKGSITLKFASDDELQKLVVLFEKLK
ncbi:MAG: ParB/RepB/Spo0J family partition protein [Muribaculaceae bacterium]|nr:ParB/RepB/Spo0J family partition protein [Muribaculaceae bacterium]